MANWLKHLLLAENLDLVPETHVVAHNHLYNSSPRESNAPFFWQLWIPGTPDIRKQNTHIYKIKHIKSKILKGL